MIAKFLKISFLFFLILLIFSGCNSTEEETKVEKIITTFYKSLNNRDYKKMESLMSDNMRIDSRWIKRDLKEFVVFKKIYIKDVVLNTITATVTVECTDEFNNKTEQSWDLIKQKDDWKINNFNFSRTQTINTDTKKQNTKKDTINIIVDTPIVETNVVYTQTITENN